MIAVKERPILFSAPMVRAILDGRKTVTRRPVKGGQIPTENPDLEIGHRWSAIAQRHPRWGFCVFGETEAECATRLGSFSPYGKPGDRLWVRETTEINEQTSDGVVLSKYSADGEPVLYSGSDNPEYDGTVAHWDYPRRSRPSIHMPRWASRILLEITDIRVERLQDISDAQCIAEGIHPVPKTHEHAHQFWRDYHLSGDGTLCVRTPKDSFESLWCHVAGGSFPKGAAAYQASPHSWDANPWVWVVEFKRVQP